jgi:putative addiction module antidote
MAGKIKVRKIGNSVGLILPKDVAEQLHVGEDDTVHYVVDTIQSLAAGDPSEEQLAEWIAGHSTPPAGDSP